jgi:hypothetical protein
MTIFILKTLIASLLISSVSWLANKNTTLAGFLTALPLTSMLALAFAQLQNNDSSNSIEYAKSIFIAVPISLLFFVPFLFANKLQLNFWVCFGTGVLLLSIGYGIHSQIKLS